MGKDTSDPTPQVWEQHHPPRAGEWKKRENKWVFAPTTQLYIENSKKSTKILL